MKYLKKHLKRPWTPTQTDAKKTNLFHDKRADRSQPSESPALLSNENIHYPVKSTPSPKHCLILLLMKTPRDGGQTQLNIKSHKAAQSPSQTTPKWIIWSTQDSDRLIHKPNGILKPMNQAHNLGGLDIYFQLAGQARYKIWAGNLKVKPRTYQFTPHPTQFQNIFYIFSLCYL